MSQNFGLVEDCVDQIEQSLGLDEKMADNGGGAAECGVALGVLIRLEFCLCNGTPSLCFLLLSIFMCYYFLFFSLLLFSKKFL